MSHVAWTTAANAPDIRPVSDGLPPGWGAQHAPPPDLDESAADQALAALGYQRTGPWVESGGLWAAEVSRIRSAGHRRGLAN